jgi:hypothetical protein
MKLYVRQQTFGLTGSPERPTAAPGIKRRVTVMLHERGRRQKEIGVLKADL